MSAPARTHRHGLDIPDVLRSATGEPPSRRYGAVEDAPPTPWSRILDWLGAVALLLSVAEEIADAAGVDLDAAGHLIVAATAFAGLAIYGMRVGTREFH